MSMRDRLAGREPVVEPEPVLASVTPLPTAQPIQPYSVDRPLTAAAERINLRKSNQTSVLGATPFRQWQDDAWDYYDAIGEIKFAFTMTASVFSRLRLYPAIVVDPDAPPVSTTILKRRSNDQSEEEKADDVAAELSPPSDVSDEMMAWMEYLVGNLGNGKGGFPGLLRQFALNVSVSGECYLCQIDRKWSFRSTQEITVRGADGVPLLRTMRANGMRSDGSLGEQPLPRSTYVARVWRQHPRYSGEPDSSMLGLRDSCDELLALQRMVRALARSKMNAGMLLIADSISSASQSPTEDIDTAEQEADAFENELMQHLVEPVMDESSVATISPMVGRGPAEDIEKGVKYIQFTRESDRNLVERIDRVLERILQGIDVPKDLVTGLANVKYSNAVQIDESLYKSHIEPLALLLVDALTQVYLRPAMKAKFPGIQDDTLNKLVTWYDPTEVVTRPDAATSADTLYEKYELSGDALRRAHGFADTDAPSEDEMANRMAITGAAMMPPEIQAALVKHLLPGVFAAMQREAATRAGMPQSAVDLLHPEGAPETVAPTGARPGKDGASSLDDSGVGLSAPTGQSDLSPDQLAQVPPGMLGG